MDTAARTLRVGIVGYGGAGRGIHARLVREAGHTVTAVVVRSPGRRAAAAAAGRGGHRRADVAARPGRPRAVGARAPKGEAADEVRALAAALPGRALHLLVESALGVERAFELATASPQVASLGLGEAALRSDLRGGDEAGRAGARRRVVGAARAAGLPSPAMSAFTHVRDLDGLAASCRAGRSLGFCGRTAIHPAQLDTIRDAFLPTPDEVDRAREVVERVGDAAASGTGVVALADGTYLGVAWVARARPGLALADRRPPG